MSKKKRETKTGGGKSKIPYWIVGIVILTPILLLGRVYLSAKEGNGSPTVGSRLDNSLSPATAEEQLDKVKSVVRLDGAESVEVNLIGATLRISIGTKDDVSSAKVKGITNEAYDKVNDILPIEKYSTSNGSNKMYGLEVHIYNFIPDNKYSVDDRIYKIKTKTATTKKPNVSTPSSPKNKSVAKKLLKQQEEAVKKNK